MKKWKKKHDIWYTICFGWIIQGMKDNGKKERPICPKCGKPMRQRRDPIARRYTGYLWGCKCSPNLSLSVG